MTTNVGIRDKMTLPGLSEGIGQLIKTLLSTVLILFIFLNAYSCDICGCSSGNYFIGPFPQFKKHFIGIRYSFRSYHSVIASDATQFSKDFYRTFEIWGGLNLGKKWQTLLFLPYNINRQVSDDGINEDKGIGDVTAILNYKLLDVNTIDLSHILWIGAGVKIPSGKYNINPDDPVPSANNQAGTGSVDFLINTSYAYHIRNWGISSNVNYKINLSADNFKFGNRFFASSYIYRTITTGKTTVNPNAGLIYEYLMANENNKITIPDTGGYGLFAATGLEVYLNKITVGVNMQFPLTQNFSNGQTTARLRGMVHLTYSF